MKALIGTKLGMGSMIADDGKVTAVTLIQAGPMSVVKVKTVESDGYEAVVLGYGKAKKPAKAQLGKAKTAPKIIKEFKTEDAPTAGEEFDASVFSVGDSVKVTATGKGKGFAGTVKRHNFNTGPKTHGSDNYRKPGSIGSMYPQKVFKGKRMAGQMGGNKVTTRNLKVMIVDPAKHLIGVSGAVPGPRRGLVSVEAI
jgi:large subunit ribosomal protein L3